MSGKELLSGMSFVDERFVEEAENERFSTYSWTRWASMAACLCLLVMALVGYGMRENAANRENAYNQFSPDQVVIQQTDKNGEIPEQAISENSNAGVISKVSSVILRVESWTEDGFIGSVEKLVDTDSFTVGTVLTVRYAEKTPVEVCVTDKTVRDESKKDESQDDTGILVEVRVISFDEEAGTIVIESMTPVE